jgi:molybdopterin-guanine dinucleotide biosynthesis protein A
MFLGVVILAGGRSSRMGADKAVLDWAGRRAVDRLADLARTVGALAVVTSGATDYGIPLVEDREMGGGPVAGLVSAGAALAGAGCDRVLALAVDAPTVGTADLAPLIAALHPGAAYRGLNLPLAWDLAATPRDAGGGWSVRRFIDAVGLARLACPAGAEERLRGANTPAERAALMATLADAELPKMAAPADQTFGAAAKSG